MKMASIGKLHFLGAAVLVFCVCEAQSDDVTLIITGSGEEQYVVAGGNMYLECLHDIDVDTVTSVTWTHSHDSTETTVAVFDLSNSECGQGDYASRASCDEVFNDTTTVGHRLTLEGVQYPEDNADFRCTVAHASSSDSEWETANVHVELLFANTYLTPPSDPVAETVLFECYGGHAKPVAEITWTHNGNQLGADEVHSNCDQSDQEYCDILSILTLTTHLPGDEVVCSLEQGTPYSYSNPITHVYVFPADSESSDLTVELTSETTLLEEGDNLTVECTRDDVVEDHVNSVLWTKDGNEVATYYPEGDNCNLHADYDGRDITCSVVEDEKKHMLGIENVQEADTGDYACSVSVDQLGAVQSNELNIRVTSGSGGLAHLYNSMWMITCVECLLQI